MFLRPDGILHVALRGQTAIPGVQESPPVEQTPKQSILLQGVAILLRSNVINSFNQRL